MEWLLIINILLLGANLFARYKNESKYKLYLQAVVEKEREIEERVESVNMNLITFRNYYNTKIYEHAMTLLQLKEYHVNLLTCLDSIMDYNTICILQDNIFLIDENLKEISFIIKTLPQQKTKLSILDKVYIEESKFSKN